MELTDIEEIFNLNSMQDDDIDNIINDGVDVYCQVDGLMDTSSIQGTEIGWIYVYCEQSNEKAQANLKKHFAQENSNSRTYPEYKRL